MKTLSITALILAGAAYAQVPPEVAKQLVNIGRGVCVPQTAQVYRPLQPNPPYTGITIARRPEVRAERAGRGGCVFGGKGRRESNCPYLRSWRRGKQAAGRSERRRLL